MKFLHLSDLHVGLRLFNRDLCEDQQYILHQITETAVREHPDAVIIAGDIYDKAVPSAEAVQIFDQFISELSMALPDTAVMLISGNHDSGARLNCFRSVLSRQNMYMIGLPPQSANDYIEKAVLTDEFGNVNFYLLPFVKPSSVKQIVGTGEDGNNLSYDETLHRLIRREHIDRKYRNVLVSHQFYLPIGSKAADIERMDSEIRTVGNIDAVSADILDTFDYAALGHIHRPMKVGSEFFRYSGTPIACSVSEAGQQKGIIMVEMREKGNIQTTVIPLKPLRQVRVIRGNLDKVLEQHCDDYVSVILTDTVDLDILDMQDRIRNAFPNLLEIRRETMRTTNYSSGEVLKKEMDPFELCCSFLKEPGEEEKNLLSDVINTVQEVKE